MTITRDEDVLGGEPRIDGTRVGVRHVATRVIDGEQSPAGVADQFDITLSDVYEALSYYTATSTRCVNSVGPTKKRSNVCGSRR